MLIAILHGLPDLTTQEWVTTGLSLATIALLVTAHQLRTHVSRITAACSSIAMGGLAALSFFAVDVGQFNFPDFDTEPRAKAKSGSRGSAAGGGGAAGGGAASGRDNRRHADMTAADGSGDGDEADAVDESAGAGFSRVSFVRSKPVYDMKPFRDCPACPEMVPVPAGYALVGAAADDPRAARAEQPQRIVTIGKPFAIGRAEITVGQYEAFAAATGRARPACTEVSAATSSLPVQCVSFADAKAYADWLSIATRRSYRLPSASQWEYAARSGTNTAYASGESLDAKSANIGAIAARLLPAASFPANGFGLYDMAGNVAELTADCWTPTLDDTPSDGQPAVYGADCSRRTLKDAAWPEAAQSARVSARRPIANEAARPGIGFRIVRDMN